MGVPTQLAPQFDQQFTDNNGVPLAGGFVYTYAAGTTTPLAAYTDSTGNTPQTNPIVLDGNGRAPIWLGSSAYKLVLQNSSNVTLLTVDNVSYINSGSITSAMLAAGAVQTSNIANNAITSALIASGAVGSSQIASGAVGSSQIASGAVGSSQIASGSITTSQISPTAGILPSQLSVGSGLSLGANQVLFFTFTVFSANATQGAVYSNNSNQFTVSSTISGGTTLVCTGNGFPSAGSTTLTKVSGTGDATISVSASTSAGTYYWTVPSGISRAIALIVGSGGGGAGGGGGSYASNSGGNGGNAGLPFITPPMALTAGNVITIINGAGGAAGAASSTGGNGNASQIISGGVVLYQAPGANGGSGRNPTAQIAFNTTYGNLETSGGGGAAAANSGAPGQASLINAVYSANGGIGNAGQSGGGGGGHSMFGAGGTGATGGANNATSPASTACGAGGGGGCGTNGGSGGTGAAGASGAVIIYY
jgi:hypothetical protein